VVHLYKLTNLFEFLIFLYVTLMMIAAAIETRDERIISDKHIFRII